MYELGYAFDVLLLVHSENKTIFSFKKKVKHMQLQELQS